MSTLAPSRTPQQLHAAWQTLKAQQPRLRARDAAAALQVSEAQLTASRLGIDTRRLRPDWAALLPALGELGYIMALTRNEHCVHERKGHYRDVTVTPNGQMGLVVSPDIDLRLFLGGWNSVFAVEEASDKGAQRSIQVFDKQGTAVHKVYLTEQSNLQAWTALIERFAAEPSPEAEPQPLPAKPVIQADSAIAVAALREDWAALKDTHHFYALLKQHGVSRTQGLRLAGEQWAQPLPLAALPQLLEQAGAQQVPIMLFVGNAHCIQIHTGTVSNLRWLDSWFNVLDPEFNLHLQTQGVTQLWRVRKPSTDGVITSWEAFDAEGELVLQLFGARKPGVPELTSWRELAEQAAALPA